MRRKPALCLTAKISEAVTALKRTFETGPAGIAEDRDAIGAVQRFMPLPSQPNIHSSARLPANSALVGHFQSVGKTGEKNQK